ncbi:hypothetical protein [Nitrospirillum sp. BR 11163]|uniref:hypothetical protein n=1 Tax=Nitrospirillum sp. BR 11163 TaxID=3104323 RepID=UPI002AFE2F60|nr:hypothetical protein [Nitrospirillum sp. BR 11163]MEA1674117.1 hypothetical protein [Nitrospirillum sp. BR 11163]
MTTEVTILSKKPNHNPFRVRVIQLPQDVLNAAIAKAAEEHAASLAITCGRTVEEIVASIVREFVLEPGQVAESHRDYVHDGSVIVIDEIRPS